MSFISDPAAAFGQDQGAQLPKQFANVIAQNAISSQELVALSTSPGYVIRNLVATGAGLACGVALHDAGAAKGLAIVTGGWAVVKKGTAALTAGNIAVKDPTVSGAVGQITNGAAVTLATDVRGFVGTVATAATAGDATVNIFVGKF